MSTGPGFRLALMLALLLPVELRAASPGADCVAAAGRAETEQGLPPGLLLSVGRIESGRYDAVAGGLVPWPFAVNVAGRGAYPASRDQAVALVAAELASGIRSIDVGCFQINLYHHPAAFASLDEAFDPDANARYAARFLRSLHERTGGWATAVGSYHSADPARGGPYSVAVLSDWTGERATARTPPVLGGSRMTPLPLAVRVGVIVPTWAGDAHPLALAGITRRLPRVVTPSMGG